MIGFPRWCNTKEDFIYIREHFPREQWAPQFQALLDARMAWLNVSQLASEVEGITDDTHKVVTVGGEKDGTPVQYYQYEYREDKNCRLFQLGFTVEEVEGLLR
jgi:hypothetical protein